MLDLAADQPVAGEEIASAADGTRAGRASQTTGGHRWGFLVAKDRWQAGGPWDLFRLLSDDGLVRKSSAVSGGDHPGTRIHGDDVESLTVQMAAGSSPAGVSVVRTITARSCCRLQATTATPLPLTC
jgi:hypothetical protein